MEKAKVYFTDFHASSNENLLRKLRRLITTAGINKIDFDKKFAALKLHFGEMGNLAYLRPNYAKVIADVIKDAGGNPFVTDCNTLYVGKRKNAIEHLDTAYTNGYNPFATGVHTIIADGLKGTDEVYVKMDGEYIKEAKIGRAIYDSDVIISVNHFKCHEQTGIGGAIKNLGMGCGSRAGKMEMHSSGKPFVITKRCTACGVCVKNCAHGAISFKDKKAFIDHKKCVGCGRCIGPCHFDAVKSPNDESNDILNKKIAEYTYAVLKDKPHFHISFIMDVSPFCDCHNENDIPIVPDVGMVASFDPVAIDKACADLVNEQPVNKGSQLDIEDGKKGKDHFATLHPTTNWMSTIEHGEKLGIGSSEYELIKI